MPRGAAARWLAIATLLAALVAVPASAANGGYDLPQLFGKQIAGIKQKSRLPVLLPHSLPVSGRVDKA